MLLFLVEPLAAKQLLPWFGGSAAVWTTCMLFFQVALLGGYAYAHVLSTSVRPRQQRLVHIGLILASLALLPVLAPAAMKSGQAWPIARVLMILAITVGLPFFVLATTGTLAQAWWTRLDAGRSPYRLYAISNTGSLVGLLAYPFVLEPLLGVRQQAYAWSAAMLVYGIAYVVCTFIATGRQGEIVAVPQEQDPAGNVSLLTRIQWITLPACSSLLLLAITAALTQNVAPIPFLWILPLALYLISFILCFEHPRWYHRGIWIPLCWAGALTLTGLLMFGHGHLGLPWLIALYSLSLLACSMVCHGELYRRRPAPQLLTQYYLLIALGGALGGLFVAVAAPLIFDGMWELHLGIGLCVLLCCTSLWSDRECPLAHGKPRLVWIALISLLTILYLCLWNDTNSTIAGAHLRARCRSFYGVLSVWDVSGDSGRDYAFLHHGEITHGVQYTSAAYRREPLAYYYPQSGIGRLLQAQGTKGPIRVGVVGLGSGVIAAYGRPQDSYRFYELNPQVIQIARSEFSYLQDCPAATTTVVGDARLSLEAEPANMFDVLAVDAFSGDSIPTHLLTIEAMQLYARHLKPGGALALHITNSYLDLTPVLARASQKMGWHLRVIDTTPSRDDGTCYPCTWAIMSASEDLYADEHLRDASMPVAGTRHPELWTDDRTDLLRILR